MKKKIYCKACDMEIMEIPIEGRRYLPIGTNYITVSARRFDCDINIPAKEELPYKTSYEYNHYYHFKCFKHPIPDIFPEVIDLID